jgi:hypothetical protein
VDHIIAGRFATKDDADAAAETLAGLITTNDVCIFHNSPPGQHGVSIFGEDEVKRHHELVVKNAAHAVGSNETEVSKQQDNAETSALATAAAAGAAAGLVAAVAGPVAALAAVGVAAYTGSLAGALQGSGGSTTSDNAQQSRSSHASHHDESAMRQGGVMLAVHVIEQGSESEVIRLLHAAGAKDIEEADGIWGEADWIDFDPLGSPNLVEIETRY